MNLQVVFDSALIVEHNAAAAVSVEKLPHQFQLHRQRHLLST